MSFEDTDSASRMRKYAYYGEKIVVRALVSAVAIGLFILFWDGWVQGSAQYWEARKTVDICAQQSDAIMDSDHLRKTCQAASIIQGTYPVFFAMRFTMLTLIDWTISTICHIGGSWLSSGAMGVLFAFAVAYFYRRATTPYNPYLDAYPFGMQAKLMMHHQPDMACSMPPQMAISKQAENDHGGNFLSKIAWPEKRGPTITEVDEYYPVKTKYA
jgi:hypothetical protein